MKQLLITIIAAVLVVGCGPSAVEEVRAIKAERAKVETALRQENAKLNDAIDKATALLKDAESRLAKAQAEAKKANEALAMALLEKQLADNQRQAQKSTDKLVAGKSNPVADKYLLESAAKGDIDDVKIQLGNGANVDAKDSIGRTPLHIAAGSGLLGTPVQGNKEIADLLIEEGADVDAKYKWGDTPLHVAVRGGNKEIVEMLIESNADYDLWDQQGETPLDWAKIDRDANNRDSYNAAGKAVKRRSFSKFKAAINEIAELLRKHGAKTGEELKAERRAEGLPFP